jgi:hypothetical protein
VVQVDPSEEVAYTGLRLLLNPTATNKPALLTATELMLVMVVLPLIRAGVVQVDPSAEVAYTGKGLLDPSLVYPTATNRPALLTVIPAIVAFVVLPFITVGVVQVDPSALVAYEGRLLPLGPTATNKPALLTAISSGLKILVLPARAAGVVQVDPSALVAYTGY